MLLLVVVSISTRVAVAVVVLVACPRCFKAFVEPCAYKVSTTE